VFVLKTVRIWFRKVGIAKYISHLDLNRCMSRAMRRAKIPAWVTEGFNPHLFLTFALPLSLGQEGLQESMDIKLPDDYDLNVLPEQLNAVLPEGLEATRAAEAQHKPAAIDHAVYALTLRAGETAPENLANQLTAFLAQPEILVVKKTKTGEKTMDLKPYLNGMTAATDATGLHLTVTLPAGNAMNINTSLFTDALEAYIGAELQVRVVREKICEKDGKIFS
jgi:radical SAM-linked protein